VNYSKTPVPVTFSRQHHYRNKVCNKQMPEN